MEIKVRKCGRIYTTEKRLFRETVLKSEYVCRNEVFGQSECGSTVRASEALPAAP